jgi:hypothetical protein
LVFHKQLILYQIAAQNASTIFKKDENSDNFSFPGSDAKKAQRGRAFSLVKKRQTDYNITVYYHAGSARMEVSYEYQSLCPRQGHRRKIPDGGHQQGDGL